MAISPVARAGATIDGSGGINLGGTVDGYIYNYSPIELAGGLWADPGLASLVAPVGQFMGFDDNGIPLALSDLIPLGTTSVTIFTPEGQTLFKAEGHETQLGGKVTLLEPQGDISMGIYQ